MDYIYITVLSESHTVVAVSYHARHLPPHQELFGVQHLAQGHFDMWAGGTGD